MQAVILAGGLGTGLSEETYDRPVPMVAVGAPATPRHTPENADLGGTRRQAGLPMVTLRPALPLGPHQAESFFTPSLIRACLAKRDGRWTADNPARDLPGWEATFPIEERLARSMAWQREARDHAPSAGR